ncbi:MAG: class I SAM-dependent methyltransferase [Candidatus Pacebacteria bacterium]|jgi:SAM-dependent methyltransferase|nr:class I SAM-dependent methyltransferase [Candidatus Paceibacterota bacterium]
MNKKRLKDFWNKEYKDPEFFALSEKVSADLEKYIRFMQREFGDDVFRPGVFVLDLGCGNGRNLIYLADRFGVSGIGYDISEEAIKQAQKSSAHLGDRVQFAVRSISEPLPLPDASVDLILDLMSSHFLAESEREVYRAEMLRVLTPDGFLLFKSFYAEGDVHARKLVAKHGAGEKNAYIHPRLKVYEYVWTDEAIAEYFEPHFIKLKEETSHKHFSKGRPNKRRSIICYFQKRP